MKTPPKLRFALTVAGECLVAGLAFAAIWSDQVMPTAMHFALSSGVAALLLGAILVTLDEAERNR